MEWSDWQASLCPKCGGSKAETMDPENEGAYDAVVLRCFKCAAGERKGREFGENNADMAGLFIATVDTADND